MSIRGSFLRSHRKPFPCLDGLRLDGALSSTICRQKKGYKRVGNQNMFEVVVKLLFPSSLERQRPSYLLPLVSVLHLPLLVLGLMSRQYGMCHLVML